MSNEETKIKYAVLHAGIYIQGAGNVGPTLNLDVTASKLTKMTLNGNFLVLEAKNPQGLPIPGVTLVPLTNVTHLTPA